MSIFDAAVHSDMHDDMRRNAIALLERMTTVEQQLRNVNVEDALRLARVQASVDGLTARVNGIDATLAAQAYCIDALQLKPTEPTSTPERCHIGGCVNPLPPYIFPFCAKCGLPTCTAHVYEHPAPLEDDADNTAGWCKTCHDTATQPEPVQRAYVMIADECGVTECTTRVEPDESNQCNHCGKPTCWAHKNHPDVMYCDDCWNGMRDTPTIPALVPDDGPATCYICGIDHDIEDVATCNKCQRTVCFDHSTSRTDKHICKACDYDEYTSQCLRITRTFVDYEAKKREIAEEQLYHARTAIENAVHERDNASFFTTLYHQQSAHASQVQKEREQARLVATLQAITIKQLEQQIRFAQSHLTVLDVILSPNTPIVILESEEE